MFLNHHLFLLSKGRSSLDYHILQTLNGQSMLLLSWDGVLSPRTLSFVNSYVVSYAPLSQDGSAFKNYTNFTTSTSSALFDIKLNTNYSIMVSVWFNTLGGLTLAPLVNKGFTIDTSAEGMLVYYCGSKIRMCVEGCFCSV